MRQQLQNKMGWLFVVILLCMGRPVFADDAVAGLMDRLQLVRQQIELLKKRDEQAKNELTELQKQHDIQLSGLVLERSSKSVLDKSALEISVAKSNLESMTIEISDARQTMSWLEKNIQEIENQLNVLSMFGLKVPKQNTIDSTAFHSDLVYQQKLLDLEKIRYKYLQSLEMAAGSILQLKKENYQQISLQLKTYRLLNIKQQQVKDELAFQQQQSEWLRQLNELHTQLQGLDPARSKSAYLATERAIFFANESANYAYVQSLIARYRDQIQQMRLAIFKSNSISLLNEIGEQVVVLNKQIARLEASMQSRKGVLDKHVHYLSQKKTMDAPLHGYIAKLSMLSGSYKKSQGTLSELKVDLVVLRKNLDKALQVELSSRQGFPTFGFKSILDLGKEMLLVPALTYHIVKSLANNFIKGMELTTPVAWGLLALAESLMLAAFFYLRKLVSQALAQPSEWHGSINAKWLSMQWLNRNFIEFVLMWNLIGVMAFFGVPFQNYLILVYLSFVWLIFKSIITISRVCLVESEHHGSGHDVRLYARLKWIIGVGGLVTALTVFLHQLPLIYELKTLADRLFLLFLMGVSLLLLRSWSVVPNLIESHFHEHHPYFQRSVRFVAFFVPILLLVNSLIGLCGYVNLVMTISGYEGIFLLVLMAYLTLRGLLSDAMEQVSHLVIRHVSNGWLWTQAFLKPIDTVLRITLFLSAWAVLFLLYGWDSRSPIVGRLNTLLHYKLIHVANTMITPIGIIELCVVVSVFYWSARWAREFVYRLLTSRTHDMGLRNSIAILSQYCVIFLGAFLSLRVLGIDLQALYVIVTALAFGIGFGLRDLANNFVCGFLILLERPLRVGDIVSINNVEGEVTHIGSRAVTVRTWDHMDLVVPNAEIFNKSFTNWTFKDNVVRTIVHIVIGRQDNPHEVKRIIQAVLSSNQLVLNEPMPQVFLKEMNDTVMDFEIHYYINIRQVKSRVSVISEVLMNIWDVFTLHGIKPPYPQQEIFIKRGDVPVVIASPVMTST